MKKPYLSIIIPAYNEEDNLKRGTLDQVHDFLKKQSFTWEIIVVNDGSSDDTLELLKVFAEKKSNIKIIDNPHQGKALTVITGGLQAAGDVILFSDLDQATPISETTNILAEINSGFDIVIGSRAGRKGAPLFRQILAYGNVILRTIILGLPFKDTQCGFKAFKAESAKRIFTIMKHFRPSATITGPAVDPGFDVELLYLARKLGLKVKEVPVAWHYQETRRVRFVYDMLSGLQGLFLVRWRSLVNAYNL